MASILIWMSECIFYIHVHQVRDTCIDPLQLRHFRLLTVAIRHVGVPHARAYTYPAVARAPPDQALSVSVCFSSSAQRYRNVQWTLKVHFHDQDL